MTSRSGSTRQCSHAHTRPVRPSPDCTSSRISSAPRSSQIRRTPGQKSSVGTRYPAVAGTVSMHTAAVVSPTARSTAATSPKGTLAMPGTSGPNQWESRSSSMARAKPTWPWYPCSAETMPGRPVTARASLQATSTASPPPGVKNVKWRSPGRVLARAAAALALQTDGTSQSPTSPISTSPRRSASRATAGRWPRSNTPPDDRQFT